MVWQVLNLQKEEADRRAREEEEERRRNEKENEKKRQDRERELRLLAKQQDEVSCPVMPCSPKISTGRQPSVLQHRFGVGRMWALTWPTYDLSMVLAGTREVGLAKYTGRNCGGQCRRSGD